MGRAMGRAPGRAPGRTAVSAHRRLRRLRADQHPPFRAGSLGHLPALGSGRRAALGVRWARESQSSDRGVGGGGAVGEVGGLGGLRDVGAVGGVPAVAAALRAGATPAVAWQRGWGVRSRDGIPEWADVVAGCAGDSAAASAVLAAARLAAATGAPLAMVLDRVGVALAEEADIAGQRRAAFAGPRATARLLAWLPAFGVLLGMALGADPLGVLLDGRAGSGLLAAAGALSWCGWRWSRRVLRSAAAAGGAT